MSKLTSMAKDLLIIDEDFYMRSRDENHKYIDQEYYDFYFFDQWWPDTTCGFGGIGGQAFTQCPVYAFVPKAHDLSKPIKAQPDALIYIGNRFAYKVPKSNVLLDDISRNNIRSVYQKDIYIEAGNKEANIYD